MTIPIPPGTEPLDALRAALAPDVAILVDGRDAVLFRGLLAVRVRLVCPMASVVVPADFLSSERSLR